MLSLSQARRLYGALIRAFEPCRDERGRFIPCGGSSGSQGKPKPSPASKTPPSRIRQRLKKLQDDHERITTRLAQQNAQANQQYNEAKSALEVETDPKARAKLTKQLNSAEKKSLKAYNEYNDRQNTLTERARKLVEVPAGSRGNTPIADPSGFKNADKIQEGIDIYHRYTTRDVNIPHKVELFDSGKERSYADPEGKYVAMEQTEQRGSVMAHEMGHVLEANHPEVLQQSAAFVARRTAGEKPQRLRDITGNKAYDPSEVTKPDKFHNAYVGKTYQDASGKTYATEVTSMGIERLHADPIEFAKNDPDYFDHTVKALRGSYLQ
jgi:hypothetical protein